MCAFLGFSRSKTVIYMVGGACALVTSSYIGKLADKHGKI